MGRYNLQNNQPTGQSFGINNNCKTRLDNTGGTIYMYDGISITHDYNYANTNIDISGCLSPQGREF